MPHHDLTPVPDVLAAVLAAVRVLDPVDAPLGEAAGLVLARDLVAWEALPRFDNAAMDGYAVGAVPVEVGEGSSRRLQVAGVSFAGPSASDASAGVEIDTAWVITTGARVPEGAEAVVPVEDTVREGDTVTIVREAASGANIRRAGEDVRAGETVILAGTVVGPGQVAAAAALGMATLSVRPRPRMVVVPTGDEVVPPGGERAEGQVFDAGGHAVAAGGSDAGASVRALAPVGDRPDALVQRLRSVAADADLLVTVGGVSVGQRDVVRRAGDALGLRAWRVALRPAKPFALGRVEGVPLLALPGNPAAALVSFEVFCRPAIRAMRGLDPAAPSFVPARLAEPFRQRPGRLAYVRARCWWEGELLHACPASSQGAGAVGSLGEANGWLVFDPDVVDVPAGATVRARPMWGGAFESAPAPTP